MKRRHTIAQIALVIACVAGILHAAASIYWALGGRWLLDTVGAWAIEAVASEPALTSVLLGAIGVAKLLAVSIPIALSKGKIPWLKFWRIVCWIGAIAILLYGLANVVISSGVLLGIINPGAEYDHAAMIGHAFLWDPLFAVWGAALLVWLCCTRKPTRMSEAQTTMVE